MQKPRYTEEALRKLERWTYTEESYRELMEGDEAPSFDSLEWEFSGYTESPEDIGTYKTDSFLELVEWALEDIIRDSRVFALRACDMGSGATEKERKANGKDSRYWTLEEAERKLTELGLSIYRDTLSLDVGSYQSRRERGATLLVSPSPLESPRDTLRAASRSLSRSPESLPLFLIRSEPKPRKPEREPEPVRVYYRAV